MHRLVDEAHHDIAGDVGDLKRQRKHVELTHDLQDELGVHPGEFQQVEQVRRVTESANSN